MGEFIPVIIVGGGGCGLSMSAFLSDYGVEHILFERKNETSTLPKAHYLNQRTMETFRLHSLNEEIQKKSCPPELMSHVAWATSLGGSDPLDRRVIHDFACFGGDDSSTNAHAYIRDAPERSANLPLCRMEPILRRQAEEKNPDRIRFNHTVVSFSDQVDHVMVKLQNAQGDVSNYRTRYLIGADGGRFVGPSIGAKMEGRTGITDMVSVHFEADLSHYWDERFFACHFINGSCCTIFESGAVVPMGPTWGRKSEEWVFHFGFDLNDDARFQEEKLIPRIRDLLKIPDLDIKLRRVSHWIIEKVVADKYRVGNVFLAGDAAHRRPPTTGLGLNTAIEDALNLSWKLAMVLKHNLDPGILDTYEQERKPVGKRNADWGLFTFENSAVINAAVGLVPGQKEHNLARFQNLFEESLSGQSLRAQVRKMIDSQRIEFSAHGIELGFVYEKGFKISDGTDMPLPDPLGQVYNPTTRPGHRLPHVWFQGNGRTLSSHDLVGASGSFLLLTDEMGLSWVAVANRVSLQYDVSIKTVQVGPQCPLRDRDNQWEEVKEIGNGGAILVRPDNFVAWRSKGPSNANGTELEQAVQRLWGLPCDALKLSS